MRALLALLLLALAAPAAAQQQRDAQGAPTDALVVPFAEGRLIRFDRDVAQVFVADQDIADVQIISPRVAYVYGRRVGTTTVHAVAADERLVASLRILVQRGAQAAQGALPPSGVRFEFLGNRLIARGPVRDLGEALEVESTARGFAPPGTTPLDRTRLGGAQQVNLRVRFAEVSRNDLDRMGINWAAVVNPGAFAVGLLTGGLIGTPIGPRPGFPLFPGAPDAFGNLAVSGSGNRFRIDLLVEALRREGVLSLLAEPNLTSLSGQSASFLAGGEIPIPVPQGDGIVTIQYRPFGIGLEFTPTVLPGERIGLRLRPEVSDISTSNAALIPGGFLAPSFIVRRAETSVELASGETLAIAGLFQRRLSDDLDRLPVLGELPVLGPLFRSARFQRAETELLILVTPFLVRPNADPRAIPMPTQPLAAAPAPTAAAPLGPGLAGFVID